MQSLRNFFKIGLLISSFIPVIGFAANSGFAESPNFVVYAPNQDLADKVLLKAEEERKIMALFWFGKEIEDGVGPSMIHIKIDKDNNTAYTWPIDHPKKKYHRVTIIADSEKKILGSFLNHEITHTVMANYFSGTLPRWADEAIATYSDLVTDSYNKDLEYRKKITTYIKSNEWPSLRLILSQSGISSMEKDFYPMSLYFTQYLMELFNYDNKKFFAFAVDLYAAFSKKEDPDVIIRAYLPRFRSLGALESSWHQWATDSVKVNNNIKFKPCNISEK